MFESINAIDTYILLWVHDNHIPILDWLMPFITDQDNWIIPILFLILFLGFFSNKKGRIALALLVIALSCNDFIFAQILKPF